MKAHKTSLRGSIATAAIQQQYLDCFVGFRLLAMAVLLCMFGVLSSSAYAQTEPDVTTGLVGYWKMDETSGTGIIDYASNNDGTVQGGLDPAVNSVTGRIGTALDFDGVNDQIIVPASSAYGFPVGFSMTASGWIKILASDDCTGNKVFISNRLDTNKQWWFGCHASNDALFFNVESGGDLPLYGTTPINDGRWHHVAAVYNGTSDTAMLYLDGRLDGSQSLALTGDFVTGNPLCIGNYGATCNDSYYYNGSMDDVRLYDRALSAEDIAYLQESFDASIKYDTDARVPKYFNGEEWVAMGERKYVPNAVNFGGSGSVLSANSLSGVGDTNTVTISMWVNTRDPGLTVENSWLVMNEGGQNRLRIGNNTTGRFEGWVRDSTNVDIIDFSENSSWRFKNTNWNHLLISIDTSTSQIQVYINDVLSVSATVNSTNLINLAEVDDITIKRNSPDLELADVWVSFDDALDFTIEANRRKFIDENGDPVFLGNDGSNPTGRTPDIYLTGDTETWHINKGTAGGFTENQPLTDVITLPGSLYGDFPTDGLVGYWKMDEISGSSVIDYASGNNGTYLDNSGSASTVQSTGGVHGGALGFYNHKVALGQTSDLDFSGTNAFTISAWVKPTDVNGSIVFQRGSGIINNGSYVLMRYHVDRSRWRMVIQDGSSYISALAAADSVDIGKWALISATWDGTNLNLYKDGVQIATGSDAGFTGLADNPTPAYQATSIGASGSSNDSYANGDIDDVAVYNRALSTTEITDMYNAAVCTNPDYLNGTIIYNNVGQVMQYCDGDNWRAMGPVPGDGAGGCLSPTGTEGEMVFNDDYGVMQYCEGDEWVRVGPYEAPSGPTGCDSVGDQCNDGSFYAGLSPDGSVPMYMAELSTQSAEVWSQDPWTGDAANSDTDGDGNTAILVGLTDAGDPYAAAEHCDNLDAHGYTDWYLPAPEELLLIYNSGAHIGDINTGARYYSSKAQGTTTARQFDMSSGNYYDETQTTSGNVRCVRKE